MHILSRIFTLFTLFLFFTFHHVISLHNDNDSEQDLTIQNVNIRPHSPRWKKTLVFAAKVLIPFVVAGYTVHTYLAGDGATDDENRGTRRDEGDGEKPPENQHEDEENRRPEDIPVPDMPEVDESPQNRDLYNEMLEYHRIHGDQLEAAFSASLESFETSTGLHNVLALTNSLWAKDIEEGRLLLEQYLYNERGSLAERDQLDKVCNAVKEKSMQELTQGFTIILTGSNIENFALYEMTGDAAADATNNRRFAQLTAMRSLVEGVKNYADDCIGITQCLPVNQRNQFSDQWISEQLRNFYTDHKVEYEFDQMVLKKIFYYELYCSRLYLKNIWDYWDEYLENVGGDADRWRRIKRMYKLYLHEEINPDIINREDIIQKYGEDSRRAAQEKREEELRNLAEEKKADFEDLKNQFEAGNLTANMQYLLDTLFPKIYALDQKLQEQNLTYEESQNVIATILDKRGFFAKLKLNETIFPSSASVVSRARNVMCSR